jgi:phosphoglycolate phosphatase-like HAD superfamily hydrolase
LINMSYTQINCFLFDLDGTLVKTHIDFDLMRETVQNLAEEAGARLNAESNTSILESAKAASESLGSIEGNRLYTKMLTALEDVEEFGCSNPEEIPGAYELLTRLRDMECKIGVFTRNCRRVSTELLTKFNLPTIFCSLATMLKKLSPIPLTFTMH